MWIDVHAHLYDFPDGDLEDVMNRARDAGVIAVVNAGTGLAASSTVCGQCTAHPDLFGAVGISPFDVEGLEDGWWNNLEALLDNEKVLAVGETGLDDTNPAYPSLAKQVPVFERLLALARDRDLPVVIHSRGAERRVVEICRSLAVPKVLLHCYTGDTAVLRAALDLGYYVSFSGIATFRKAPLDRQIADTPLERLFIETDTPYLAPVPHRGRPNEPAFVPLIGAHIAHQKGISPAELAGAIRRNFAELFGREVAIGG